MPFILNGALHSRSFPALDAAGTRARGIDQNTLFEAGRKEDAFLRLRNFGFPDAASRYIGCVRISRSLSRRFRVVMESAAGLSSFAPSDDATIA